MVVCTPSARTQAGGPAGIASAVNLCRGQHEHRIRELGCHAALRLVGNGEAAFAVYRGTFLTCGVDAFPETAEHQRRHHGWRARSSRKASIAPNFVAPAQGPRRQDFCGIGYLMTDGVHAPSPRRRSACPTGSRAMRNSTLADTSSATTLGPGTMIVANAAAAPAHKVRGPTPTGNQAPGIFPHRHRPIPASANWSSVRALRDRVSSRHRHGPTAVRSGWRGERRPRNARALNNTAPDARRTSASRVAPLPTWTVMAAADPTVYRPVLTWSAVYAVRPR